MTRALPFSKANIKRRIDALREAGIPIAGITADGTVLTLTAVSRPELITQRDDAVATSWDDV
jgi:hypothetical protein